MPVRTLLSSTHTRTLTATAPNVHSVFRNLPPMCQWACASGRPADPLPPSSQSSGPAAPRWSCWGPGTPSPASPEASCCSGGRTPSGPATPRRAGTAPPGTQTFPCRWGWAGRGIRPSCTSTSLSLWNPAWSASRRCLRGREVRERHQVAGYQYCLTREQSAAAGLNSYTIAVLFFIVLTCSVSKRCTCQRIVQYFWKYEHLLLAMFHTTFMCPSNINLEPRNSFAQHAGRKEQVWLCPEVKSWHITSFVLA